MLFIFWSLKPYRDGGRMKQAGKAILSFKLALPGQGDKGAKAKAKAKAQTLLFQLSRKLSQINSMSAPCASDNSSEIILL